MISKTQIKDIREKIQAVLDAEGIKLGMDLKMGNITYDDDGFRCKLEGRWEDSEPRVCTDYNKFRARYDLPRRGAIISINGQPHQIYGYKKRATKRPVIVTDMGGTQFVISRVVCNNAPIIQEPEEA